MSRKLNPHAAEFIPRSQSDVIYIVRKGVVEEIRLEDSYKETSNQTTVWVNHFFGWSLPQVVDFLRAAPREDVLDILYEAMRQKSYLPCFGVLLVYAFQKGVPADRCEESVRRAYSRFFKNEEEFTSILQREIDWAKRLF